MIGFWDLVCSIDRLRNVSERLPCAIGPLRGLAPDRLLVLAFAQGAIPLEPGGEARQEPRAMSVHAACRRFPAVVIPRRQRYRHNVGDQVFLINVCAGRLVPGALNRCYVATRVYGSLASVAASYIC
jgi:hypothetical protein